ncbi:hypothetical protein K438DRAFT_1996222 [Mycena galopus ATCC 62051]|nr:hypothetical protein K438DRAFT_1996222 [Mycena galopus ATCC 62051]
MASTPPALSPAPPRHLAAALSRTDVVNLLWQETIDYNLVDAAERTVSHATAPLDISDLLVLNIFSTLPSSTKPRAGADVFTQISPLHAPTNQDALLPHHRHPPWSEQLPGGFFMYLGLRVPSSLKGGHQDLVHFFISVCFSAEFLSLVGDELPLHYPSLNVGYLSKVPFMNLEDRAALEANVERILLKEKDAAWAPIP